MKKEMKVYKLLLSIPKGKVTTYKAIGEKVGLPARYVGKILSKNGQPDRYPCYKVVRSDHRVGGYTIKGKNNRKTVLMKIQKLKRDRIVVKNSKVQERFIVRKL